MHSIILSLIFGLFLQAYSNDRVPTEVPFKIGEVLSNEYSVDSSSDPIDLFILAGINLLAARPIYYHHYTLDKVTYYLNVSYDPII